MKGVMTASSSSSSPDISPKYLSLKWPFFSFTHLPCSSDHCHFPGPWQLLNSFPLCVQSCSISTLLTQQLSDLLLTKSGWPHFGAFPLHLTQNPNLLPLLLGAWVIYLVCFSDNLLRSCLQILVSPGRPASLKNAEDVLCSFPLPPVLFPPLFTWLLLILYISALLGLPWPSHSPLHPQPPFPN